MKKKEWKEKYIQTLVKVGGLTKKQALENYNAADEHAFDDDPKLIALDELSYREV